MEPVIDRTWRVFTALASVPPYPKAGSLHYLDATVPAADRLEAACLVRDLAAR